MTGILLEFGIEQFHRVFWQKSSPIEAFRFCKEPDFDKIADVIQERKFSFLRIKISVHVYGSHSQIKSLRE